MADRKGPAVGKDVSANAITSLRDPKKLQKALWPHLYFYDRQWEVIYSFWENDETVVPAGNMLGKDFTAGWIAVAAFITRYPCRGVTTSAKDDHLRVLWGEVNQHVASCKFPLDSKQGGPLIINHQEIRRVNNGNVRCPKSYLKGLVAAPDSIAAMQGHHIANTGDGVWKTFFMSDESSSVPDEYFPMVDTWANRKLIFGNTWECHNYFRRAVDQGDLPREAGDGFYRKVVRITAEDSPNVRLGLAQERTGKPVTNEVIVPGVKTFAEYKKNRLLWDDIQQCVSLDAQFYVGKELRLFPKAWLDHAMQLASRLRGVKRRALAVGIDPAEGGDKTALCAVDERGVVELVSFKTPDTNQIPGMVIAFGTKHKVPAERWVFDRGGGGKQHADRLRDVGYAVRTVAFGESPTEPPKPGTTAFGERLENAETRGAYVNRRAEMYGTLSNRMDPSAGDGFAIPAEYAELFTQLAPIPKLYDGEGKLRLPPKHKKVAGSKEVCLTELIGHSPDEADSLVLSVFGMLTEPTFADLGGFAV